MIFHKLMLGKLNTNCYIVADENTKNAALFDPADSFDEIFKILNKNKYNLKFVFLTHAHFDHVLALRKLKEQLNPVVCYNKHSSWIFKECFEYCKTLPETDIRDLNYDNYYCKPDKIIEDSTTFKLDDITIIPIYTPGHSIDSTCFLVKDSSDEILISGDTLFYNSIGRWDILSGNFNQEIDSIKNKLFVLKDDIKVYPGHGWKTSIGFEKLNNINFV